MGGRIAGRRVSGRLAPPDGADRLIAALASPQHGVVTRRQVLELGLSPGEIAHRLGVGRLHRLHDGVYAVGHRPVSPHAHAMAAVLAGGPRAALSHGSAATLWGVTKEWATPLEVTAPGHREHRRLRIHRSLTFDPLDVTEHFGVPVTTPARTLFDLAPRLPGPAIARAVSELRLARYLWLADLAELLDRVPPCRAGKLLRHHLAHPERAPTRSEFERTFLAFAQRQGLPEPAVNRRVAGHEVDILFPAHRLVVELDGYGTHGTREQFEVDRERDADLLAADIATLRVTWERLNLRPDREAARLREILARREPRPPSSQE